MNNNKALTSFLSGTMIWWIIGAITLLQYDFETIFKNIHTYRNSVLDLLQPYITYMGTGAFMIIVVLLILMRFSKYRNLHFIIFAVLMNGVPALVTQLFKRVYKEPRPMQVFKGEEWLTILPNQPLQYSNSFPSGHTTGAFSFYIFLALTLFTKNHFWGVFCFLAAFITGFSRIYLAQHFFIDVYVGSIIGTTVPIIIYYFYTKKYSIERVV